MTVVLILDRRLETTLSCNHNTKYILFPYLNPGTIGEED